MTQPLIALVLRDVPPVASQNDLALTDWQIREKEGGDRFLLGLMPNGWTIRMTSAIQRLDPVGRTVQTGSGRRYQLSGSPTRAPALLGMMAISAVANGLQASVDVTEEVWKAIVLATH